MSVAAPPRPAIEKSPEVITAPSEPARDETPKKADKYKLILYNDPVNTREHVARTLCKVVGFDNKQAFDCMMKAHTTGSALVGIWGFELAESYHEALRAHQLVTEIFPVDEDD
mmetsp:Transcript_21907/g.62357  ORF Transcript_21907/g.62357 Transcript_21907/m.62357 type:complete len:113 (-) Transcript_21907:634-972(-)